MNGGEIQMGTLAHSVPPETVQRLLALDLPPYLRRLFGAMRDGSVGWISVRPNVGNFDIPRQPGVVLIVDNGCGPSAFCPVSVTAAVAGSSMATITTYRPVEAIFAAALLVASSTGKNVLIIETGPEQETAWVELISRGRTPLALLLGLLEPEGRA